MTDHLHVLTDSDDSAPRLVALPPNDAGPPNAFAGSSDAVLRERNSIEPHAAVRFGIEQELRRRAAAGPTPRALAATDDDQVLDALAPLAGFAALVDAAAQKHQMALSGVAADFGRAVGPARTRAEGAAAAELEAAISTAADGHREALGAVMRKNVAQPVPAMSEASVRRLMELDTILRGGESDDLPPYLDELMRGAPDATFLRAAIPLVRRASRLKYNLPFRESYGAWLDRAASIVRGAPWNDTIGARVRSAAAEADMRFAARCAHALSGKGSG